MANFIVLKDSAIEKTNVKASVKEKRSRYLNQNSNLRASTTIPGRTVKFIDKSPGSPTSWLWKFGDGSTSKVKNPVHKYATAGKKYTVTLTVKNAAGSSTVNKYVTPIYLLQILS